MIMNLLACAIALGATTQDPEQATLRDSISGVWKGVATDAAPLLPEEGLPAFESHFDPKTRVLEFKVRYQSIPLTVGDDELTGTVAGLGLSIDLAQAARPGTGHARRSTHRRQAQFLR